jgi:hypothetical protein
MKLFKDPLNLQELQDDITGHGNPLDHNYEILKEFRIHESIFTSAWDVLKVSGIQ